MLTIIECSANTLEEEKKIMDSDPYHNLVSIGRKDFPLEMLLDEHKDKEKFQKERSLVRKEGFEDSIAIIDFTMCNPNDRKPWLGLLIVRGNYQKLGLGSEVYQLVEKLMSERGAKEIRLACYMGNEKAQQFWARQSFYKVKEIEYNDRLLVCLEKKLNKVVKA